MLANCLKEEKIIKIHNINIGIVNPGPVNTDMQTRIRKAPNNPLKDMFTALHKEHKLTSKETIANFFSWLLLKIPSSEFSEVYWDFDDEKIRQRWQQENYI